MIIKEKISNKYGLSLVELIITLSLIGIVIVSAISMSLLGLRSFNIGRNQSNIQYEVRRATNEITDTMRNATNIKTSAFANCDSLDIDKLIASQYDGEFSYEVEGNMLNIIVHADNGKESYNIDSHVLLNNFSESIVTIGSKIIYFELPEEDYFSTLAIEEGNDDATLKDLLPSEGTLSPNFVSSNYEYSVTLPSGSIGTRIISTASPTDVKAKTKNKAAIDINGNPAERTATSTVTAENGKAVKKYRVTFTVHSSENSDCSLVYLGSSDGEWNKEFLPDVLDYIVELPFDTTIIPTLSFTKQNEMSTVKIIDTVDLKGNKKDRTTIVNVSAEDGITNCIYTIEFQLKEKEPEDIKVESINIQGDVFFYPENQIQFSAIVNPDNAKNNEIIWSIDNGGNLASINQDGLLKSKNNLAGDILVKATSMDGSKIDDTFTVTKFSTLTANYSDKIVNKKYTCTITPSGGDSTYKYAIITANKDYTLIDNTLTMTVKNKNDKVSFKIRVTDNHNKTIEIIK
jgi:type II secretory pathway pseudopilin PulG